jgi:hypothetical protein
MAITTSSSMSVNPLGFDDGARRRSRFVVCQQVVRIRYSFFLKILTVSETPEDRDAAQVGNPNELRPPADLDEPGPDPYRCSPPSVDRHGPKPSAIRGLCDSRFSPHANFMDDAAKHGVLTPLS